MTQMIGRAGHEQQLVALQSVLHNLQGSQPVESLVTTALDFLQSEFDYSLIWLALHDTTANTLIGMGGIAPREADILKQSFSVLPGDTFDQVLLTGRSEKVTNLQENSRVGKWRQVAQHCRVQGALIHPLRYQEQSLGLLLLGSPLWGYDPRAGQTAQISIFSMALAASLYQHQQPSQAQDRNKADDMSLSMLGVLEQVANLPDVERRLQAVVQHLHQLIAPTRTSLYWLEPQEQLFWQRVSYQTEKGPRSQRSTSEKAKIDLKDMGQFAQALRGGQMTAVSDALGAVHASMPTRLMVQMKSRSLLSAPILAEKQLLGFLALEGAEPHVWQEHEKTLVRSAAQLLSLSVRLDGHTTDTQSATPTDDWTAQLLSTLLNPSVRSSPKDQKAFFKQILMQVSSGLQVQWVVLLRRDSTTDQFHVEDQLHGPKRRPLTESLAALSDIDQKMLQRSTSVISIDNLKDDLRLLTWRDSLMARGMRSLSMVRFDPGLLENSYLLVGCDSVRTWNPEQEERLQQIAHALGVVKQQQHLQDKYVREQQISTVLQEKLITFQEIQDPDQLGPAALQSLVDLLQVPFAALLQWTPGQPQGWISTCITTYDFNVVEGTVVEMEHDPLIQQLLNPAPKSASKHETQGGLIQLSAEDLMPATRQWLNCPHQAHLLAMALPPSPSGQSLGAVVVGDITHRSWNSLVLTAAEAIVQHFAITDRSVRTIQMVRQEYEALECLNWHKQRQLEGFYHGLAQQSRQLQDLLSTQTPSGKTVRQNRIFDQMQQNLSAIERLLCNESWQLSSAQESVALSKLLRTAMMRVDGLAKTRNLWIQVHNQTPAAKLLGASKLESILSELLLAACERSAPEGRIDVWCRLVNDHTIEVALTDNGQINPKLIKALKSAQTRDLLVPSILDLPQSRCLKACQSLVMELGGKMKLGQLEDGRAISRLILPLDPDSLSGSSD